MADKSVSTDFGRWQDSGRSGVDLEAVERQFLQAVAAGDSDDAIAQLTALSQLLEEQQYLFRTIVGDPYWNSQSTLHSRSQYDLGKLVDVIMEHDEEYQGIAFKILDSNNLKLQVAVLRFVHAVLSAWHCLSGDIDAPLTDDVVVERIQFWATSAIQDSSTALQLASPPPTKEAQLLEEARQTYSLGLLVLALSNEELADALVGTDFVQELCRYLHVAANAAFKLPHLANNQTLPAETAEYCNANPTSPVAIVASRTRLTRFASMQDAAVPDVAPAALAAPTAPEGEGTSRCEKQPQPEPRAHDDDSQPAGVRTSRAARRRNTELADVETFDNLLTPKAASKPVDKAGSLKDPVSSPDHATVKTPAGKARAGGAAESSGREDQDGESMAGTSAATASDGATESSDEALQPHLTAASVRLRQQRMQFALQCLSSIGEYIESLGFILQERAMELCLELVQHYSNAGPNVTDVLKLIYHLLAHRRLAEVLVDCGGVAVLLRLPRNIHTSSGIACALLSLAFLPPVFERICMQPDLPGEMMAAMLQMAEGSNEAARFHCIRFLGASVHFRMMLEAFDERNGLRTLMKFLHISLTMPQSTANMAARSERATLRECVHTLRQYMRAHFMLQVIKLKQKVEGSSKVGLSSTRLPQAHKSVEVSEDAVQTAIHDLQCNPRLYELFLRADWSMLKAFAKLDGPLLMLQLLSLAPIDRSYKDMRMMTEIAFFTLDVLQLVTLAPPICRAALAKQVATRRNGMSVLLSAVSGRIIYSDPDPELMCNALQVLCNCISVPPALEPLLQSSAIKSTPSESRQHSRSKTRGGSPGSSPLKESMLSSPPQRGTAGPDQELASLDLGSPSVSTTSSSSVAAGVEQALAAARNLLRSSNGIKTLLSLLQTRTPQAVVLHQVRALTCKILIGLCRDPNIRQILQKLQVGRLLAGQVHDSGGGRAMAISSTTAATSNWQDAFNKLALELIALTATTSAKESAAASADAAAPALHKIERAAIAAATPITYYPQELLELMYEHLRKSGLHNTAASLAEEAFSTRRLPTTPAAHVQQQHHTGKTTGEPQSARPTHPANTSSATPRKIAISAYLRDACRSTSQPAVPSKDKDAHSSQEADAADLRAVKSGTPIAPKASAPLPNSAGPKVPSKRRQSQLPMQPPPALRRSEPSSATPAAAETTTATDLPRNSKPSSTQQVAAQDRQHAPSCSYDTAALATTPHAATATPDDRTAQRSAHAHHGPSSKAASKLDFNAPVPTRRQPPPSPFTSVVGHMVSASDTPGLANSTWPSDASRNPASDASYIANMLLSNLPSRGMKVRHKVGRPGLQKPSKGARLLRPQNKAGVPRNGLVQPTDAGDGGYASMSQLQRASMQSASKAQQAQLPLHIEAASLGSAVQPATESRLHNIIMQYLRQQHRQACMTSQHPMSTLPPISLLKPHTMPQPKRLMDAAANIALRQSWRESFMPPWGGRNGRRACRHYIYSRFRLWRGVASDSSVLQSCCFTKGNTMLALGNHNGDIKLCNTFSNDWMFMSDQHSDPVNLIDSHDALDAGTSFLLTSSKSNVKLWDVNNTDMGCLKDFEGVRGARFNHEGSCFAAVMSMLTTENQLQAHTYDVLTGERLVTMTSADSMDSGVGGERGKKGRYSVCFSPSDKLLLWSNTLWDPRAPRVIHEFDQFTDFAGGVFHPSELEVIMNSEVWDLRTFKLMRSVPCLDATSIKFNAAGDVIYAVQRRTNDDISSMLNKRRSAHNLYTAFRTVDATNYQEITTYDVDRCILDLACDPTEMYLAVVLLEAEMMSSTARLYSVGKSHHRVHQDELDEDDDDDEDDEDDDDDDDMAGPIAIDFEDLAAGDHDGSPGGGLGAAARLAGGEGERDDDEDEEAGDWLMDPMRYLLQNPDMVDGLEGSSTNDDDDDGDDELDYDDFDSESDGDSDDGGSGYW